MTALADRVRGQAEQCRAHGSPLMLALLRGAADDLDAGGVVADLLAPHLHDPAGSVASLRLAGALHRLVLERRAPLLALHYPSVGGTAPVAQVWPAARDAVEEHLADLRQLVRRPVQTNEVGRSAVLFGGLRHVAAATGLPVHLLEVGASAGLNLHVDRYAYRVDGVLLGDPASPVVLDEPWRGTVPPGDVTLVGRAGCDPAPVDPATTEGRLTLTSYVWADQLGRLERLRGALAVAGRAPVPVEELGASDFLARELAEPRPGVATVVWQSVVRQYLDETERRRLPQVLDEAGSRATAQAPLVHLAMEPEAGASRFSLTVRSWPGGTSRVLAGCRGHGPPVTWR